MIRFNELRLSEDRKALTVDCIVEGLAMYDSAYIDTVRVYHYSNYASVDRSDDSGLYFTLYDNAAAHGGEADVTVKHVRATMFTSDMPEKFGTNTFKDGLFYVRVECVVTNASDLARVMAEEDCSYDNAVALGVVVDWQRVYEEGLQYVRGIYRTGGAECADSRMQEEFILRWNYLKLAVSTSDWDLVNDIWESMFVRRSGNMRSGCGCGNGG